MRGERRGERRNENGCGTLHLVRYNDVALAFIRAGANVNATDMLKEERERRIGE